MSAPTGFLVVANGGAGSADREAITGAAGVLAEHRPTELVWTSDPDDLDTALDRVDGRRLVIAGGDGSIHTVVNALERRGQLEAAVGIVPAGTGNDTARGLGLPLDPAEAAEVVGRGSPRRLPLLEVDGHGVGVNNLHLGVGVAAAERGTAWKPRVGRLAYPAGTVVAGLRHPAQPVAVTVDGRRCHDAPALAAVVALGPSAGGGVELVDGVDLADPCLDVVVVDDLAVPQRLGLAWRGVRGDITAHHGAHRWTGAEVEVTSPRPFTYEVDGEMIEGESAIVARVRAGGWSVLVD